MEKHRRYFIAVSILTVVYFGAGKLGLHLASLHPSATAIWPCSGIALAALLIRGYNVWPGVLLGALLVNLTTFGSLATSIGIAVGNTSEALIGAYLVSRLAHGRNAMYQTQDIFKFAILAGFSTIIAATVGVTSLAIGGFALWENYGAIWLTWWLGDAAGDVIVAPLLLLWTAKPDIPWRWTQTFEAAALLACLFLVGLVVFNGVLISGTEKYPLEYLCLPVLVWAAFRFGQREAAIAMIVLCGVAIWGTVHKFGPFARESSNESLLLLQTFLGVGALMTLALGAEVALRRRAEKEALSLATIDPLTGLGNYRKLVDVLESEIRRYDRTKRSFAFLLLDLDGLKDINDIHGHLVGNRALCRLADALRILSRSVDPAARHGGDEFALILPETGLEAAYHVADRIAERLATDGEYPALSVSIGVAVWPEHGGTLEILLREADRALYEMKKSRGGKRELAEIRFKGEIPN